jgi:hypothetical protein
MMSQLGMSAHHQLEREDSAEVPAAPAEAWQFVIR